MMALCDVNQEKLIVNSFKRFHNVLFLRQSLNKLIIVPFIFLNTKGTKLVSLGLKM